MTIIVYHTNIDKDFLKEHKEKYINVIIAPNEENIKEMIAVGGYKKIAEVMVNDLEKAYELTNSIDSYWGENKEVFLYQEKNKSSSVGDLFIKDNELYYVNSMGFTKLDKEILKSLEYPSKVKIKI